MPDTKETAITEYQAAVEALRTAEAAEATARTALDHARAAIQAATDRVKVAEAGLLRACQPVKSRE